MTARKAWVDISLFVVAIGLGIYLALTAGAPTSSELIARKDNVFPAFERSAISEIRLSSPEEPQLGTLLRRKGGATAEATDEYFLGEGEETEADRAAVTDLLNVLEFSTFVRVLSEENTSVMGLSEPQAEVRILAGPRTFRLLVGKSAPAPAGAAYAQVSGPGNTQMNGVIPAELVAALKASGQSFKGNLLFPIGRKSARKITMSRGDIWISLVPEPSGFFVETSSSRTLADRDLVDLLFFHLARAKLERFVDTVADTALPKPHEKDLVTVTLFGEGRAEYEVVLGAECPEEPLLMGAVRSPPHALSGCVTRTITPALITEEKLWPGAHAVFFKADEIDHVVISEQDKKLDLMRKDAGYILASREGQSIPSDAGDEFLQQLSELALERVNALPADAQPLGTLTVTGQLPETFVHQDPSTGSKVHRAKLTTHRLKDGQLFVSREDDGAVFSVPQSGRWVFRALDAWARERTLLQVRPEEIREMEVQTPNLHRQHLTRTKDGVFLNGSAPADPELSRFAFEELAHLSAVRFLEEETSPDLERTKVRFTVDTAAGSKSYELALGGRVRGGILASANFTEGSFVLPLETQRRLMVSFTDRAPVTLEPDDLLRLQVEVRGHSYEFELRAGVLRASGGEASDHMVASLIDALRAVRVLSASPSEAPLSRMQSPRMQLSGERKGPDGQPEPFKISLGGVTAWMGQSAEMLWQSDASTTFFVQTASLEQLDRLF